MFVKIWKDDSFQVFIEDCSITVEKNQYVESAYNDIIGGFL